MSIKLIAAHHLDSVFLYHKYSMTCGVEGSHKVAKAVADGPVGPVLAGPTFTQGKTKFYFTQGK